MMMQWNMIPESLRSVATQNKKKGFVLFLLAVHLDQRSHVYWEVRLPPFGKQRVENMQWNYKLFNL